MPRPLMLILGTALLAAPAAAQWSDTANLSVADNSGEQVQPKTVATSDGGHYVSWFDNSTGGYDVYLQRVDAAGVEQWAHNGVLVADRGFSSTQDYGLDVATDGSALLVFRDDRFGGEQITAARVMTDGTLAWGVNGVQLTSDAAFHAAPGIAGTSGGNMVVAWTNDSVVKLQSLDAAGTPLWGAGVTLSDSAGLSFADIHGSTAGGVILSWVRAAGFSSPKILHCQKLDVTGSALWNGGNSIALFDTSSLQFGNFPDFITDGSGGAVFSWYTSGPLQCFAQRILADGTEAFPHNGSPGSTNMSNTRVSPDAAFDPATNRTYLFWTEMNSGQSQRGVSGQCFDANGAAQWSATGAELLPLSGNDRGFVQAALLGDGVAVGVIDSASFGNDTIRAARVNSDGTFAWAPALVDVSHDVADLGRLAMIATDTDEVVLAWQHDNDIRAQNLNGDGSMGPSGSPCPADFDSSGSVDFNDLVTLLAAWGTPEGDIDGDGTTGFSDLIALLAAWGSCP